MNNNININIVAIDESISRLQVIKNNLTKIYESNNNVYNQLTNSWNGTVGENVQQELKEHNEKYNNLINELDKKINYLRKNVVELYNKVDLGISHRIDESIK